jgi:hypothetical protein
MLELYETLHKRRRPEDVAEMIRVALGASLSRQEGAILEKAARYSLKRGFVKATSMLEDFQRPLPPERQVRKALELFRRTESWSAADCADPGRVEALIKALSPLIGKQFGASDFKLHRLNGEQRVALGLDLSRRRYNKLFRFLARLERKLRTYVREQKKYEFTCIGKSRFATRLTLEEFGRDADTAAFIAYYAARCNLRSVFTNLGQQRPYDEIADMLMRRLRQHPERTNWWAVAQVHPHWEVLEHLSDLQCGRLLGMWLATLSEIAALLREVWEANRFERSTMIVQRGNDSSTWNKTANAWNRARDAWIALLDSMGMQEELDALCFGKALRLMAADVAAWHKATGGKLDADTLVWNELPLPWEVFAGSASCTRARVEETCRKHGVDPIKKGWIAPPPGRRVEKFQPTPELVHGVAVAGPELASVLRKAGWFSGRDRWPSFPGMESVVVDRDAYGFALGARRAETGIELTNQDDQR